MSRQGGAEYVTSEMETQLQPECLSEKGSLLDLFPAKNAVSDDRISRCLQGNSADARQTNLQLSSSVRWDAPGLDGQTMYVKLIFNARLWYLCLSHHLSSVPIASSIQMQALTSCCSEASQCYHCCRCVVRLIRCSLSISISL